ncbi:hypothetical protein C8R48DRAFT_768562 [Suillus tomentosus]|nr:hypothetical protein C8R48DRAFT_768562 [Suillus tomentosus]
MSSTTSPTLHSSSRETTPEPAKTPLWMSLYVHSVRPPAVNEDTISSVPSANNPRPLRAMPDNAEYWVSNAGEAFTFKFPATLDIEGQFDRSGAYFNLPRTGLDLGAIKKMRAQFEVRPLDAEARDVFPAEAIRCSSATLDMLNVLHGEAEDARNAHDSRAAYPRDAPFWRTSNGGENNGFSIVVTTDLLLGNIPDPAKASVPRLRRCDIGSTYTRVIVRQRRPLTPQIDVEGDTMQSPSKAKAAASAGSPPSGDPVPTTTLEPGTLRLSDLPDPLGRYAAVITQYGLQECTVIAPNVRDGHGVLIGPHEYRSKLKTGDVVMLECQLKLWTISPSRREGGPGEDRNGSRRYQVMLKSMQLLPDARVTPATFANYFSDVKGKRKAHDVPEDDHPNKRFAEEDANSEGEGSRKAYGDADDDEDLYGEQPMQVTD